MNVQDANLQDLLAAYYEGTRAAKVALHLRGEIVHRRETPLAMLLRDYRERDVTSSREIELRAGVDDLLICCDVLEIATLAGYIAPPVGGAEFWDELTVILENPQVRDYYVTFYPMKLPQLLAHRLRRRHTQVEKDGSALAPSIVEFLALDQRFMATLNDGFLLRMLDSFEIDGYWFSDIVSIVADPGDFIRRLLLPPEEQEVPDKVVHELSTFLQFCFDLQQLLRRLEYVPLLQSEVWSHYGYWFGIIGEELNEQLGVALDQFLRWTPIGPDQQAAGEIQDYVAQARHALGVLTSPTFAAPVNRLLEGPRWIERADPEEVA